MQEPYESQTMAGSKRKRENNPNQGPVLDCYEFGELRVLKQAAGILKVPVSSLPNIENRFRNGAPLLDSFNYGQGESTCVSSNDGPTGRTNLQQWNPSCGFTAFEPQLQPAISPISSGEHYGQYLDVYSSGNVSPSTVVASSRTESVGNPGASYPSSS